MISLQCDILTKYTVQPYGKFLHMKVMLFLLTTATGPLGLKLILRPNNLGSILLPKNVVVSSSPASV